MIPTAHAVQLSSEEELEGSSMVRTMDASEENKK